MDLPLLGAAVALGISWGGHIWGQRPDVRPLTTPCICHCECASVSDNYPSLKLWILVALLAVSWIGFGIFWLQWTSRDKTLELPTKGKGKKGVTGSTLALTLQ